MFQGYVEQQESYEIFKCVGTLVEHPVVISNPNVYFLGERMLPSEEKNVQHFTGQILF